MAGKIKGITIQINGDTQGLDKALKGVNDKSKSLASELRDVEKGLKFNPKNTELMAQKQKLLAESVDAVSDKLKVLKDAEKQAQKQFEKGEISEAQYRALKREIIDTEGYLKHLETQQKKVNDKFKQMGDSIKGAGQQMKDAGQKFTPISAAAGAAVVGMGTLAYKAGQAADDINTLAKVTGLSTDTLQKFSYASDVIDVSMETLTGSLTKLTRNMNSAKEGSKTTVQAFEKIGVSVTDANGELRDNEDVFYEVIKALGDVANETERDAIAMQIFGKSAQELNPLILGGADTLKKMGEEAEKMGLILSQEALDDINEFNDEIDVLKGTAKATSLSLGASIGKAMLPLLQLVAEKVKGFAESLRDVNPAVLRVIMVILAIVAAIAPFLIIVGQMAIGIGGLISLFGTIGPIIAAIAGPVGVAILAIAALVTIGVGLYKNWDKIKQNAKNLKDTVVNAVASMRDKVKGIFEGIMAFGDRLADKFASIADKIKNVIGLGSQASNGLEYAPKGGGKTSSKETFEGKMTIDIKGSGAKDLGPAGISKLTSAVESGLSKKLASDHRRIPNRTSVVNSLR